MTKIRLVPKTLGLASILMSAAITIAIFTLITMMFKSSSSIQAEESFERIGKDAVEQEAVVGLPCGEGDTRLYIEENGEFKKLYVRVPQGLLDPGDSKYTVTQNKFRLIGYHVVRKINGKPIPARFFDLIAWKPIAPYSVWKDFGEPNGSTETETMTAPVEYEASQGSLTFAHRPTHSSAGC